MKKIAALLIFLTMNCQSWDTRYDRARENPMDKKALEDTARQLEQSEKQKEQDELEREKLKRKARWILMKDRRPLW